MIAKQHGRQAAVQAASSNTDYVKHIHLHAYTQALRATDQIDYGHARQCQLRMNIAQLQCLPSRTAAKLPCKRLRPICDIGHFSG
jgi:hypothetical protein